jgi:hypothetical protein
VTDVRRGAAIVALLVAGACADAKDPGPYVLAGWIGQCERGCDQEASCNPNQQLFDHGDLDNCVRDCTYFLDRDENRTFLDETPDACLDALYGYARCVLHLGCDDLDLWAACGEPCADATTAAADACDGIDLAGFLEDCGAPALVGCGEV